MQMSRRTVFFVSDQTGVSAETMGHSLLTQFDGLEFRQVTLPFISTVDKAEEACGRSTRPLSRTVSDRSCSARWCARTCAACSGAATRCCWISSQRSSGPLEGELAVKSSQREGRAHGMADLAGLRDAHRRDELRARRRRRRGDGGLRARRRGTHRRFALGQDADLHLHGDAVRDLRRQLSVDRGRLRGQAAARRRCARRPRSSSVSRSRRRGCSRSATSAGPAAATRRCRSASTKCAPRRACSSASAYRTRIRRNARSRKSRAASSTARASSAGCVPERARRGVPRFTVARKRCAIVDA